MKSLNWTKSLFLMLFAASLFLISCDDDEDSSSVPNGWTQAQKDSFISDCTSGEEAQTEELCTCVFNATAQNATFAEIQGDDLSAAQSNAIVSASIACLGDIDLNL